MRREIKILESEIVKPDFWQNQDRAKQISRRSESIRSTVEQWDTLDREVADNAKLAQEAIDQQDESLLGELEQEYIRLRKVFEKLEFLVLFSQKYDSNDAIISIHAGTGGIEAQDWAEMLLRMYLRFCERKNFVVTVIDETRGQEAGIKSATVQIGGYYAYGNLKSEAGVHRLVRISPFDAEKMRHTSFALVEVLPVLTDTQAVKINESDLKIDTFRSGGPGGQSVNTTDSAVRLTHLPSGLVVKVQNERSQQQNKQTALKLLQAKLAKLQEAAKGQELAKIRGEVLSAEWGNQIRSYVLQPYKLVKDHRTDFESKEPDDVLNGELDGFVESYLRYINKNS
ncbi:MAG: peptide chain release factor 2 [Candidatus Buchananbacteria bacterium]|nr:peptide chain release factor 2 [Candidatus Buchananbacteria bacterium]